MSARITNLKDENNNTLYPVTRDIAVLDENNVSIKTRIDNIESKLLKVLPSYANAGEPFVLDFNTIYSTLSTLKVFRSYYTQGTIVTILPEPFIMNANSTGALTINFDLQITQSDTVMITTYINGTQIDAFTQSVSQGTVSISRQATFLATQSDNTLSITIGTSGDNAKVVRNIVLTLAANNAMFLHDMPETIYRCWPVSTLVYITKQSKTASYYKYIDIQNIDHSGAYTLMASANNADEVVYPMILNYCPTTSSSFNQWAYARLDTTNSSLNLYTNDNTLRKTIDLVYNSLYIPTTVNIMPYCDATYQTQILLIYPQEPRARRLRTYNTNSSFNSVQNFSNASVPVQMISNTVCTIKNGSSSGINDYSLYQDKTGKWYVNTFPRMASNRAGLELGFGTRGDITVCPPLAQNNVDGHVYLRAFICAYGTWYAYYIDYDKPNTTFYLQKTEIVPGNFDQILAGNGNVYFGVKDGGFTTFYDSFYKSISEF